MSTQDRRTLLLGLGGLGLLTLSGCASKNAMSPALDADKTLSDGLASLEKRSGDEPGA